MNNGFVNGSKVVVKINGNAVGGVLSAVCKRENNGGLLWITKCLKNAFFSE